MKNPGVPYWSMLTKGRSLLPPLVLCASILPAHANTRDEKPVTMEAVVVNATKTHTLFMGADIAINLDKDLYPVRDVFGSNWVIAINGQQREISSKHAAVDLKITPTLKLTEVSATIVGFKREAAYSFENDPSVRITRGLTHAASVSNDMLAVAQNAQHIADTISNADMGPMSTFAASDLQFGDRAMMLTAETTPAITHPGVAVPGSRVPPTSPLTDSTLPVDGPLVAIDVASIGAATTGRQTANGTEPAGKIATSGLDAMDVEFNISSARPLQNPYVVTITRFHAAGSKPGSVQNLVYARALDPIDSRLSHVHFSEDGFPFNYELIDFQLHIYNRGVEIATNLSSNRVELTRDEAFEYVKMEYLGAHRDSTLPAVPVMGQLPADLPTRIASGKYGNTFYVKVSKDGFAKEAYLDAACTRRVDDPYVVSAVEKVRFKPALNGGKPVESVAPLNLSKLTI